MKKIIFGITSLQLGGAERVLVDLANRLSNDYEITILTIYDNGALKKELNSNIKIISIYDKPFEKYSKFQKLLISLKLNFKNNILEKYNIQSYDTVIAFLEGPITRLFSKRIKTIKSKLSNDQYSNEKENKVNQKKIAWIHNDISKAFGTGIKAKIKNKNDKKVYEKYDKLVFVSEENKKDFEKIYGKQQNAQVIRNYLDYKKVIDKSNENIKVPFSDKDINLVSVCRLTEQKAIDRFINVHSKLENAGIHSKVYIIGDGPLKFDLKKQINDTHENENFHLLGAKNNPYPYIKNADYFCLLSYYEGYGMVIEEAKLLGKTIIITNTAASESLKNYKNGIIAPNNEEGIYNKLKEILSNKNIEKDNQKVDENKEKIDKENKEYYNQIIDKIKEIL